MRTEFTSPYLLSLRVNEYQFPLTKETKCPCDFKVISYLLDQQTICIRDLVKNTPHTVNHDVAVDFLELNTRGDILVFRDKKRNLYVFDTKSRAKSLVLSCSGYVQWIPDSDVLVAQSRDKMCVWYNINAVNQVIVNHLMHQYLFI